MEDLESQEVNGTMKLAGSCSGMFGGVEARERLRVEGRNNSGVDGSQDVGCDGIKGAGGKIT